MPPMNILWVNTALPHPPDERTRMQTFSLLQELNREHPMTYLTFDDGAEVDARAAQCWTTLIRVPTQVPTPALASMCRNAAAHLRSPLPYLVWKGRSVVMQQQVEELVRNGSIDVLVTDSLAATINIPASLAVPVILLEPNIEAISWYRRAAHAGDALRKRYFQRQWYRMYAYERAQCHRFDHVIAVSPEDLAWLTVEYGVRHASRIPAAVDTEWFRPGPDAHASARARVVLMASTDRSPNDDTVSYFVTEILPRIPDPRHRLEVTVVCREPTPTIHALTRLDTRLRLSAEEVDIRQSLERAAVVIAPRRIGGGARSEVLEAMAMERPVVATTVGIEGLSVLDGEHLQIADTPEQLAAAVTRVLDDPALARECAIRGAALVRSEFTWRHAAAWLAATCTSVIDLRTDAEAVLV